MRTAIWVFVVTIMATSAFYFYMKSDKEKADTNTEKSAYEVIGKSVENREIQAYKFGVGEKKLVIVGAIHGGYEWNTATLAYELIDYFSARPNEVPENVEVIIIPVANPDGLYKIVGTSERFNAEDAPQFNYVNEIDPYGPVAASRFNANGVDLNRNFDCDWQSDAVWGQVKTSAGSRPFSEPESQALREFFIQEKPDFAVFLHSADGSVFPGFCGEGPSQTTVNISKLYAGASGYLYKDEYTDYEVTGAIESWLATQGVSSLTVELSTHSVIEFDENISGVKAILESI